ncbi:hypothetical protein BCHO_0479 [Bifidobacterium choerinum]|uniref:DUF4230 domain-containing protein n=2 Tax=Bifidobacterium choerinum TaxID=35760 RepID=A0A087AI33_9BIFI|nr:hypothetical protein BCHO_0479 [Bifidobacterium choerinum]
MAMGGGNSLNKGNNNNNGGEKKWWQKGKTWGIIIVLIVAMGAGWATSVGFYSLFPWAMPGSIREKGTEDTQVIRSMRRTKEVSLLRLGVTGIISKENKSHFFNMEIPGTERARFIQYTFDAKLGFEGKEVTIKKTDENTFDITIPEFKFIGYDDPEYRVIVEQNGALSFGTQQIDSLDMINNILTDKAKKEYVDSNRDILEEQAKSFYTSIVNSISPETKLHFTFQQAKE